MDEKNTFGIFRIKTGESHEKQRFCVRERAGNVILAIALSMEPHFPTEILHMENCRIKKTIVRC